MFARQAKTRAQFKAALDYLWGELAANFFTPASALSGPHSRDYDFLLGQGMLDIDYYVQPEEIARIEQAHHQTKANAVVQA